MVNPNIRKYNIANSSDLVNSADDQPVIMKTKQPTQKEIAVKVGGNYNKYDRLLKKVAGIKTDWKHSSRSGWFQTGDIKKKRIYYFFPEEGGFKFRMVFNDKAIQLIKEENISDMVIQALESAKKYHEGTPFDLNAAEFEVKLVESLIAIKLQSMK